MPLDDRCDLCSCLPVLRAWESQDGDALRFQPSVSRDVTFAAMVVRQAVDFDSEIELGAVEVEDVPAERLFATENESCLAEMPQFLPDPAFSSDRILAALFSLHREVRPVLAHLLNLPL